MQTTLTRLGIIGQRASRHMLTASAVIGFDSDVDPDVRERVLAVAGESLETPLRTQGSWGVGLERLGAHRSVLVEDGKLALCVSVPAEFGDELLTLADDVDDVLVDREALRSSNIRRPLPRDPLDAARKLSLVALGIADDDSLDGGGEVIRRTQSASVAPVSLTLVGPEGTFVSGSAAPLPLSVTAMGVASPFLGILHVPGAERVQVLRTGLGPDAYGTRSWASDRLLEHRMASASGAVSAVLRREGLSYGASIRLAPSRPPYVMSASYSVRAADLARSLDVLDIALATAPGEARSLIEADLRQSIDGEVRQVMADSERAAVTFWGAGSILPEIFRSDFVLDADESTALFEAPRDLGREFAVTILVGDEEAIRRNIRGFAVDHVWVTAEAKRGA